MKNIRIGQKEIIHFIGIGGIGMSGLAQVMKTMGFKIQGSDQNKNKSIQNCSKVGIQVFIGNKKSFYDETEIEKKEKRFLKLFDRLNLNIIKWKEKKSGVLRKLYQDDGMLHLKAFPGRSAILIKILGV